MPFPGLISCSLQNSTPTLCGGFAIRYIRLRKYLPLVHNNSAVYIVQKKAGHTMLADMAHMG